MVKKFTADEQYHPVYLFKKSQGYHDIAHSPMKEKNTLSGQTYGRTGSLSPCMAPSRRRLPRHFIQISDFVFLIYQSGQTDGSDHVR